MRKYQYSKILELLKTIEQAQTICMYADCQETALSLCDLIDEIEGEGTEAVDLLIQYCELLFKANNGEVVDKHLRKHLIKIENSIHHRLKPTKIEIVFISYKASMSDSLESIYLAAKADPNCNAIWLPVPYYEFSPDRTVNRTVYEGQEFYPEYMECEDWKQYDIEANRPDAIFTFNPYDAGNYVTGIHPDFYCKRLRNLTDMLCYVPYFLTGGDMQDHFMILPGCIYAHKVIVQSEIIRDKYVKTFEKAYGTQFGNPEDKFIALGSPKFDKVINLKREDFTLPDEWCELIGDKKVVLYNTSIGTLLIGGEQYLKKLRHVINTFKDRDDMVLWWRPHPFIEATYQSMRPELFAEYMSIVEVYKNNALGIYDDSSDLHRAVVVPDVYYGDSSSVIWLFNVTGKPMMIQNIGVTDTTDFSNVEAFDDGEFIWVLLDTTLYKQFVLYKINKRTKRTSCCGFFLTDTCLSGWLAREKGVNIDQLIPVCSIDGYDYFARDTDEMNNMKQLCAYEAPYATITNFLRFVSEPSRASIVQEISVKQKMLSGFGAGDTKIGNKIYSLIKEEVCNV